MSRPLLELPATIFKLRQLSGSETFASNAKVSYKLGPPMQAKLIQDLIEKNTPFRIETAAGRVFEVPHRDFVNLSPAKTSLSIWYQENGDDHFAIVPLLTITSAMTRA